MLYTWGYATRTVKQLISLVHSHNIMAVVDVRLNPMSKNYIDFCRPKLKDLLNEQRIKYAWSYELGNLTRSANNVKLKSPEQGFKNLELLMRDLGNVLLLCAEKNPERCHRSYIARMMKERAGVPVVHL